MKVVVFTTDGLSREDGSVYYSRYLVIEAQNGLTFNEAIFDEDQTEDQEAWILKAQACGYKVTEPPQMVVIQPN